MRLSSISAMMRPAARRLQSAFLYAAGGRFLCSAESSTSSATTREMLWKTHLSHDGQRSDDANIFSVLEPMMVASRCARRVNAERADETSILTTGRMCGPLCGCGLTNTEKMKCGADTLVVDVHVHVDVCDVVVVVRESLVVRHSMFLLFSH